MVSFPIFSLYRNSGRGSSMKTTITSDVWETKRSQIANLYKEEEWPLKQVIKKIRTEDFNPTETQLRSRLKKWGVTKPSRQKRKNASTPKANSSPNGSQHQAELRRRSESASQLLSLPVSGSVFDEYSWHGRSQSLGTINEQYVPKIASFAQGSRSDAQVSAPGDLFLRTTGGGYSHYPMVSVPHGLANLPPYQPYSHHQPAVDGIEASSASHARALHSSRIVSPKQPVDPSISVSWKPNEGRSDANDQTPISPATPWNYGTAESCHPCSPTSLYLPDSVPVSPNGYPDYSKHFLPSTPQKFNPGPTLSPASNLDFVEPAPATAHWRRESFSSDLNAEGARVGNEPNSSLDSLHKAMPTNAIPDTTTRSPRHSGTLSQSPSLLPELSYSSSESEGYFQDISPAEGAHKFLIPGHGMN